MSTIEQVNAPTETDQQVMLEALLSLPPRWASIECVTPDQQAHLRMVKKIFSLTREALKAWFSDVPLALPGLSRKDADYLKMQRDRWLFLYSAIYESWEELLELMDSKGFLEIPSSPGDLVTRCMIEQSLMLMWESSPNASPKQSRYSSSANKKAIAKIEKFKRDVVAKKMQGEALILEFNQLFSSSLDEIFPLEISAWTDLTHHTLEKISKKNHRTRRAYRLYEGNEADIRAECARATHPQKKLLSYQWVNGEKIHANRSP